jgi:hypothetical protein
VEGEAGTQAVEMDALNAGVLVWDVLRRFLLRVGPSVLPSSSAAAAGTAGGTVFTNTHPLTVHTHPQELLALLITTITIIIAA